MKILLIRVSSLGDVLHTMPIVADILRYYPDAQIDWVVEEAYIDLVRLNQSVRHIIPFALRRWRKKLFSKEVRAEWNSFKQRLQSETYDVVLDIQGLLKTGIIMGRAKGKNKVGLANGTEGSGYEPLSRLFHTRSVKVDKHTHAILRGRLVAAKALGYADKLDITPLDFGLSAPEQQPDWLPKSKYAVFFHGTAGQNKKWPAHDWITLGKYLTRQHYALLLPWGNNTERLEAEQLALHIPSATVLPKLSMFEAIVLAQRASLVVGVDTGLTHIAAAFDCPTIEIYCASPRWKTEGNWSDRIINLGDINKPPKISQVIDAVHTLIHM